MNRFLSSFFEDLAIKRQLFDLEHEHRKFFLIWSLHHLISENVMAKKKPQTEDALEEDLEDVILEDLHAEDALENKLDDSADSDQEDLAEELSFQLEEEPEEPYKYLLLTIEKDTDHEFYLHIKHQSHGFLNYMVTKILKTKSVEFAAYKNTSLAPPVIYIRTDGNRDIKAILKDTMRLIITEWKGMGNAVAAMKL